MHYIFWITGFPTSRSSKEQCPLHRLRPEEVIPSRISYNQEQVRKHRRNHLPPTAQIYIVTHLVVMRLTIFSPVGVIHLIVCGSFTNPATHVTDTIIKVTQAGIKPTHVWNGVKKKKRGQSCNNLSYVLTSCEHQAMVVSYYVLWSLQAPSLTVMSSMAMNPLLLVFLWPVNITCGWNTYITFFF